MLYLSRIAHKAGMPASTLRLLDVAVSAMLIVVATPLMVLLAALVALDTSAAPVYWRQRTNAHGNAYRRYEFRTMRPPHDDHGRRLTDAQRTSWFGRLVRKSELAQLPQLFNVLAGDLSLAALSGSKRVLANYGPPD